MNLRDKYPTYFGLVPAKKDFPKEPFSHPAKKIQWTLVVLREEFKQLKTQREQIVYLLDNLCMHETAEYCFTHQEIADVFKISRQALEQNYKKGKCTMIDPHRPSIFSQGEEDYLKKFARESLECSKFLFLEEISCLAAEKFGKYISADSLRHYIKNRFKDVGRIVYGIPLENCRAEVSMEALDLYYSKLGQILGIIDFRYCFNIDETGEDEFVDYRKVKVFVPKDYPDSTTFIPVKRGQKRFTIVHCITSGGEYFPFYFIVPRATVPNDLLKYIDVHNTSFRSQPKGFMTDEIFQHYFRHNFLRNLFLMRQRDGYNGPALLIMDNLHSHKVAVGADPSQDYVFLPEHNLHILFLVPHSSDQTQPLDLGIFGAHKAISQRTKVPGDLHPFTQTIVKAMTSLQKASTTLAIINSFKAAGITRKIDQRSNILHLIVDRACCTKVRNDTVERTAVQWDAKNIRISEL